MVLCRARVVEDDPRGVIEIENLILCKLCLLEDPDVVSPHEVFYQALFLKAFETIAKVVSVGVESAWVPGDNPRSGDTGIKKADERQKPDGTSSEAPSGLSASNRKCGEARHLLF